MVIVYWMKVDDFFYQGYVGLQIVNCLLLKYWKQIDIIVKGFEVDLVQLLVFGCVGMFMLVVFVDLVKNWVDYFDCLCVYNDGVYLFNMFINCYGVNLVWEWEGWIVWLFSIYYDM